MTTATKMFFVFLIVSLVAFVNSNPTNMEEERQVALINSINQFSAQFYKETAAELPGENLIMSPLSADIALALLSMGAEGQTLKELNAGLFLPDIEFTKAAFRPAIEKLRAVKGVTLNVANKVYVKEGKGYALNPEFSKLAVEVFDSDTQNVNFNNGAEAAKTINTWVEDRTNKKIKDLIEAEDLTADTRLVLVNAIYFKGDWKKKFDAKNTNKQDFYLTKDKTVEVDMMHQTSKFKYADVPEWNAKVLEMPYRDDEMSMVIILPNEIDGLNSIEDKLSSGANLNVLNKINKVEVELSLPKFKIETTINLNNVLPRIGLKRIFTGEAELGGLLENDEPLYVSKAIQKAFIEVNEEGAEAAAATAITGVGTTSSGDPPLSFEVDRPFISVIRTKTGLPIFFGKYIGVGVANLEMKNEGKETLPLDGRPLNFNRRFIKCPKYKKNIGFIPKKRIIH